jgi:DNA-binding response OmpR family regulator
MAKVLIVEDDPMMSRMYQKAFLEAGFEIDLAHDGQEGLDKARLSPPAIIILDVMMPKLNGMQVLENIKADPAIKMIPVIMLSNLGGQKDGEDAVAMGAVKYLLKSDVEPAQVVEFVKQILASAPPLQS